MSESTEAAPQAAQDTTETEATETVATEMAESASAETENTEAAPEADAEPGPIPYSRFKEVNEKRKAAQAKMERLQAELDSLRETAAEKPKASETEAQPPEHLSPQDRVKWFVEHYSRGMFEREFGMPLDKAKAILGVARELSQDLAERKWGEICQANNVDPKDPAVRKEAADLIQSGVPVEKAAKVAAMLVKKPAPGPAKKTAADVEDGGLDSTQMVKEDWTAWSANEAVEAAKQGKKMPYLSVDQIIARGKQRGK